jgi:hypothetical protein
LIVDFDQTIKILGLAGAFAGFATLIWRLVDVWKAFLHIGVAVVPLQGSSIKIRTIVENTNSIPRKIRAAFLIIGPEDEDVDNTVVSLLANTKHSKKFGTLNEMVQIVTSIVEEDSEKIVGTEGRMIIPVTYYYLENVDVADENLSYEQTIRTEGFPSGTYSVRFYVEARRRLHRVVHAAFEVAPVKNPREATQSQ